MNPEVKKVIRQILGRLGDLEAMARANSTDLKRVVARLDAAEGHYAELGGAFASLENLLERALDDEERRRLAELEARVDALEGKKKAS